MTTKKTEAVEVQAETIEVEAVNIEQDSEETAKAGLFTRIGSKIDHGVQVVKGGVKKHGKKIAAGAGVAVGTVAAVAITGVALDLKDKADKLGEPEMIDTDPLEINDVSDEGNAEAGTEEVPFD